MAFDPALHDIDPVSGFMVHKDTGLPAGLVPHFPAKATHDEYPKWVPVHVSHLNGEVAPEFGISYRPRGGDVMVLVENEDEEARAKGEKHVEPGPRDDDRLDHEHDEPALVATH